MGSIRGSRRLESRRRNLVFLRNIVVPAPDSIKKRPAGSSNAADKLIKSMVTGIPTPVIVTLYKGTIHRSGTWISPLQGNQVFFHLSIPQALCF